MTNYSAVQSHQLSLLSHCCFHNLNICHLFRFYCSTGVTPVNLAIIQRKHKILQHIPASRNDLFLTELSPQYVLGRSAPTSQLQADPLINFCQLCPPLCFNSFYQRSVWQVNIMIYRVLGPISAQGFLVEPFSSGAECQKNTQTELQHQNAINLEARQEFSEQYLTWWFLMH